jgi:hypothetical protein
MTPIDAYDRLAAVLDCLSNWDQTLVDDGQGFVTAACPIA